jgi:uncharacterized paraquat-inducible protein A
MNAHAHDDDDDEWEDDSDSDTYGEDDDEPTVPCPACRREMLEDSIRCPHCGHYVSTEDQPPESKPLWVIATAVVCLLMALVWIFGRL